MYYLYEGQKIDHRSPPFIDKQTGQVEEGWCAGAAAAIATAAVVCLSTPPVGLVAGAAMLVGSGVGYGLTCLAHGLFGKKENNDSGGGGGR